MTGISKVNIKKIDYKKNDYSNNKLTRENHNPTANNEISTSDVYGYISPTSDVYDYKSINNIINHRNIIQKLIGSMSEEDYRNFIDGVENYYDKEIEKLNIILKGTDDKIGLEELYEKDKSNDDFKEEIIIVNQLIENNENKKKSAKYDYLFFLKDYYEYTINDTTKDDYDKLVEDSNVISGNKDNYVSFQAVDNNTYFSYNAYHEKHPNISPIEYISMLEKKYPNGGYIVTGIGSGIENFYEVQAMVKAYDINPEFAKTYNYLFEKDENRANEFLSDCKYELNSLRGQLQANEFLKQLKTDDPNALNIVANELGVTGEGLADGLNSFGHGVFYTFESLGTALGICEENRMTSVEEFKKMYILNALLSEEQKKAAGLIIKNDNGEYVNADPTSIIDFSKNYEGVFLSRNYKISQGIGNMLPSMGLGMTLPPLGSVFLGVSSGGNAYHNSMVEGKSFIQSLLYGAASGATESATEFFFGSIPGLSDVEVTSLLSWFKAAAKEGNEEVLQNGIDLVTRRFIFGEEIKLPKTKEEFFSALKEQGDTWIDAAITSGILNSPSLLKPLGKNNTFINDEETVSFNNHEQTISPSDNESTNIFPLVDSRAMELFGILHPNDISNLKESISVKLKETANFERQIEQEIAEYNNNINTLEHRLESDEITSSEKEEIQKELLHWNTERENNRLKLYSNRHGQLLLMAQSVYAEIKQNDSLRQFYECQKRQDVYDLEERRQQMDSKLIEDLERRIKISEVELERLKGERKTLEKNKNDIIHLDKHNRMMRKEIQGKNSTSKMSLNETEVKYYDVDMIAEVRANDILDKYYSDISQHYGYKLLQIIKEEVKTEKIIEYYMSDYRREEQSLRNTVFDEAMSLSEAEKYNKFLQATIEKRKQYEEFLEKKQHIKETQDHLKEIHDPVKEKEYIISKIIEFNKQEDWNDKVKNGKVPYKIKEALVANDILTYLFRSISTDNKSGMAFMRKVFNSIQDCNIVTVQEDIDDSGTYFAQDPIHLTDDCIVINSNYNKKENAAIVLAHELGHMLHFHVLNHKIPDNFEEVVLNARKISTENNKLANCSLKISSILANIVNDKLYQEKINDLQKQLEKQGISSSEARELAILIHNNKKISESILLPTNYSYHFSDIVDAVFEGKLHETDRMFFGHGKEYYKTKQKQFDEMIADFTELKVSGKQHDLDLIREVFGDEFYQMLDDTFNEMVSL